MSVLVDITSIKEGIALFILNVSINMEESSDFITIESAVMILIDLGKDFFEFFDRCL